MASPGPPDPNESFAVHVFIQHDQYLASVFLSSFFNSSTFPESLWKLKPIEPYAQFGTREQDHAMLGRYVFPKKLSGSTRLAELHSRISAEFKIGEEFQAYFTIFPVYQPDENLEWPEWRNKPLPGEMTLVNAHSADPVKTEGKVHLVLLTKAAALARITGTDFVEESLGKEYIFKHYYPDWTESFGDRHRLGRWEIPELVKSLRDWRHAYYAQKFLHQEKNKVAGLTQQQRRRQGLRGEAALGQSDDLEEKLRVIESKEGEMKTTKANARAEFQRMIQEWDNWVLGRPIQHQMEGETELTDDDVEPKWQALRQARNEFVEAWKSSERRQDLWKPLREKYLSTGSFPDPEEEGRRQAAETARNSKRKAEYDQNVVKHNLAEHANVRLSPSSSHPISTRPFRNADGTLLKDLSTFDVASGILLWGQILPIYHGANQPDLTSNAISVPEDLSRYGGTIHRHVYTYKSAARTGRWKVRKYFSSWSKWLYDDAINATGWITFHESIDPMEILKRARAITEAGGISNGNKHVDRDVLYIGRYDWSYHWRHPTDPNFESSFQEWAEPVIGALPVDEDEYNDRKANVACSQYFMVMDAQSWGLEAVRAFKEECEMSQIRDDSFPLGNMGWKRERIFETPEGRRVGAFVANGDTEYEFAWLVFSGKKHKKYPKADELIAIVYDAAYEVLEGLQHRIEREPT